MDLETFVKTTILEIAAGVEQARAHLAAGGSNAILNPQASAVCLFTIALSVNAYVIARAVEAMRRS